MKNNIYKLPLNATVSLESQLEKLDNLYNLNNKKVTFFTKEIHQFNFIHNQETVEQRCDLLSIRIDNDTNFINLADDLLSTHVTLYDYIYTNYNLPISVDDYYNTDPSDINSKEPHTIYLEFCIYLEILNSPPCCLLK